MALNDALSNASFLLAELLARISAIRATRIAVTLWMLLINQKWNIRIGDFFLVATEDA